MRYRRNGLALPLIIIINFCANPAVLRKAFPLFFASVSLTLMEDFCLSKQRPKKVPAGSWCCIWTELYSMLQAAPSVITDPVGFNFFS